MFIFCKQQVDSNIITADQIIHVFSLEFIVLDFQALNKREMGMSFCDVTVTLKQQEKIGNIFFLKQNTFLYKKIYV